MAALKNGKIDNSKIEGAFFSTGFINWEDVFKNIRKHEGCDEMKAWNATLRSLNRHGISVSCCRSTTQQRQNETENSSWPNFAMYDNLAHQGLTIRGYDESESNFIKLLELNGETVPLCSNTCLPHLLLLPFVLQIHELLYNFILLSKIE